jgi:Mg2+-importing ATPase
MALIWSRLLLLPAHLPYTPLAGVFGFTPVPPLFLLALALILIFYIFVAEVAKVFFYRHEGR